MGRASNRSTILEAAVRIVEERGVAGLTLEAVAARAGLTKGGLQYHFSSKEELMVAIEEDAWAEADRMCLAALGKPLADSTPDERLEAYVRGAAAAQVTKVDMILALEGAATGTASERQIAFATRWTGETERTLCAAQWIAVLVADGLTMRDALGEAPDMQMRELIVEEVSRSLRSPR